MYTECMELQERSQVTRLTRVQMDSPPLTTMQFWTSYWSCEFHLQNRDSHCCPIRSGGKDKLILPMCQFAWRKKWKCQLLRHVWLFTTTWTAVYHAPLSMELILQARKLEWVSIPFSRSLPDPGIKLGSPALKADFLPSEPWAWYVAKIQEQWWMVSIEYLVNAGLTR